MAKLQRFTRFAKIGTGDFAMETLTLKTENASRRIGTSVGSEVSSNRKVAAQLGAVQRVAQPLYVHRSMLSFIKRSKKLICTANKPKSQRVILCQRENECEMHGCARM